MRRRIMLIGSEDSGKSLLAQRLEECMLNASCEPFVVQDSTSYALTIQPNTAQVQARKPRVQRSKLQKKNVCIERQEVWYGCYILDTPAAYLDNPWGLKHLIALAQNDARAVLLIVSTGHENSASTPGLLRVFKQPIFGVITHGAEKGASSASARRYLNLMGLSSTQIFELKNETKDVEDLCSTLVESLKSKEEIEL